jgi:hypothetical protein
MVGTIAGESGNPAVMKTLPLPAPRGNCQGAGAASQPDRGKASAATRLNACQHFRAIDQLRHHVVSLSCWPAYILLSIMAFHRAEELEKNPLRLFDGADAHCP